MFKRRKEKPLDEMSMTELSEASRRGRPQVLAEARQFFIDTQLDLLARGIISEDSHPSDDPNPLSVDDSATWVHPYPLEDGRVVKVSWRARKKPDPETKKKVDMVMREIAVVSPDGSSLGINRLGTAIARVLASERELFTPDRFAKFVNDEQAGMQPGENLGIVEPDITPGLFCVRATLGYFSPTAQERIKDQLLLPVYPSAGDSAPLAS